MAYQYVRISLGDIMINFIKLKDIRNDYDISQQEMANILGVTRSAYSIDYVLGLTNDRRKNNVTPVLDLKVLGNNIKNLRIKNELSQDNLTNFLGVTQTCIVRYEKGLVCISTSNLYKLSKEFKVSISYLCGKEN